VEDKPCRLFNELIILKKYQNLSGICKGCGSRSFSSFLAEAGALAHFRAEPFT
jgi:hypothetical protein